MAILVFVVIVVVCAAMVYGAYVLEPHWVSKDGERFLCNAQLIGLYGEPLERMRETRVVVLPEGTVEVSRKRRVRGLRVGDEAPAFRSQGMLSRRETTICRVVGPAADPPKGKVVYVLEEAGAPAGQGAALGVRLPAKSRAVGTLERLSEHTRRAS